MTGEPTTSAIQKLLGAVILIAVAPLILLALGCYVLAGLLLHMAVWCIWCTRGRDVLLVYSDSPIWQTYVEEQLLPKLRHRAVILNWSERRTWRRTLAVTLFHFFGGSREFNPMAIAFRPFRMARSFRFYKPFRDFKHGKPESVTLLTEQLFVYLSDEGRSAT
jgi:hypothetical protein